MTWQAWTFLAAWLVTIAFFCKAALAVVFWFRKYRKLEKQRAPLTREQIEREVHAAFGRLPPGMPRPARNPSKAEQRATKARRGRVSP